jgi:hypothetical protein
MEHTACIENYNEWVSELYSSVTSWFLNAQLLDTACQVHYNRVSGRAVSDEFEEICKEALVVYLKLHSQNVHRESEENLEILYQDSWYLCRESIQVPSEYKTGVLTTLLPTLGQLKINYISDKRIQYDFRIKTSTSHIKATYLLL